jgi:hypothetical protein
MSPERIVTKEKYSSVEVITWDCDGVSAHSAIPVLATQSKILGKHLDVREMRNWNTTMQWALECSLSEDEALKLQMDTWFSKDVLAQSNPVFGALCFYREDLIWKQSLSMF